MLHASLNFSLQICDVFCYLLLIEGSGFLSCCCHNKLVWTTHPREKLKVLGLAFLHENRTIVTGKRELAAFGQSSKFED